jgi:hypothetical protein
MALFVRVICQIIEIEVCSALTDFNDPKTLGGGMLMPRLSSINLMALTTPRYASVALIQTLVLRVTFDAL